MLTSFYFCVTSLLTLPFNQTEYRRGFPQVHLIAFSLKGFGNCLLDFTNAQPAPFPKQAFLGPTQLFEFPFF